MDKNYIESNRIFETIVGSHAHGLATENSDKDYRGVYIMPFDDLLAVNLQDKGINTYIYIDPIQDRQIFELRHFMFLLAKTTPNILEMIFALDENIVLKTPIFDVLMAHKQSFLTKRIFDTFCAYSMAQLKRIRGHNKHITNPQPIEKPKLKSYIKFEKCNGMRASKSELSQALITYVCSKVSASIYKAWQSPKEYTVGGLLQGDNEDELNFIDVSRERIEKDNLIYQGLFFVNKEKYQQDLKKWEKYWHWKNNRNVKRKLLEEKFGIDCKHAMHSIRLLDTAKDVFEKGQLIIKRPNRDYYMSIKNGKYNFDELIELAQNKIIEIKKMCLQSSLPDNIDQELIQNIYKEMVTKYWNLSWMP